MKKKHIIKLALLGNPNVGKTSIFNKLTGLNQKIGNYLGVTVEKKIGFFCHRNFEYQIIDLPGTYSIYPSSENEEIVSRLLENINDSDHPDKIIFVADSSNLKKSLLLFRQIQDLGFPILLILNMVDEANKRGILINVKKLKKLLQTEIVLTNGRKGIGFNNFKDKLINIQKKKNSFFSKSGLYYSFAINDIKNFYNVSTYKAWYYLASNKNILQKKLFLEKIKKKYNITSKRLQVKEILDRYEEINKIFSNTISEFVSNEKKKYLAFSKKIDNYFILHFFWGYLFFFILLFFIFQCVFFCSDFPEKLIKYIFLYIKTKFEVIIHTGPLKDFLFQGIFPGVITIINFIPQIFILFFFILLMEESGYISRVIFLMDKIMRPFGLNGKSIVPLISGMACSIPAIMSSRHIENSRDRLITILSIPFMACSAKLPIYTLIISLIIPNKKWGFIHLRGIILMFMYLIGIFSALSVAFIFHKFLLKNTYKSYLIMEIPSYKIPIFKNIFISLWIHIKSFLLSTGKLLLLINIIIWVLGSFGPKKKSNNHIIKTNPIFNIEKKELDHSYLGILGKRIEPAIHPLGFDWKVGVGLLSSLITREVFVSTMNSIHEIEKQSNNFEYKIQQKKPKFNLSTGISLLFFYTFSMQCLTTLSIIKKETKSWKWPIIQFTSMTLLAYISSFSIYQILKIIFGGNI